MYIVFYKTTDVFEVEELLQNKQENVEVVPTPVQDKAYCGISIQTTSICKDEIRKLLAEYKYKILD